MIGFHISEAKGLFFDSKKVTSATDRATRRVFSRFGAFVRRSAKSSIRKRQKSAEPGKPPSSHTGLLKRHIYFLFSPKSRSVIIGPVLLSSKKTDAPYLLEHGDTVTRKRRGKRVRVTYEPHPFMGPAFEKELPELPEMWRNSVQ